MLQRKEHGGLGHIESTVIRVNKSVGLDINFIPGESLKLDLYALGEFVTFRV